jgi:hypothetical protein
VATAAQNRLSIKRNLYKLFAAASDCRTIADRHIAECKAHIAEQRKVSQRNGDSKRPS